jgi:hypothetical protein
MSICWPAEHRVGHLWLTDVEGQKLLRAAAKRVELVCDGISAWESIKAARSNELRFENI